MSSKNSPEARSPRDDPGNTTTDFFVEALNGTQSSSGSTLSSTGPVTPLINGPCNILQGKAPFSEDNLNLGRNLPEISTWSVQTDGDSTHSSLPPAPQLTDISSVPDSNGSFWPDSDGSSWPLFPTDTDWQLDFDLPFTTAPNSASTGGTSAALSELDLSQLYTQSTQGCDSAGISRELIEYLSLGEKVSTDATILA